MKRAVVYQLPTTAAFAFPAEMAYLGNAVLDRAKPVLRFADSSPRAKDHMAHGLRLFSTSMVRLGAAGPRHL